MENKKIQIAIISLISIVVAVIISIIILYNTRDTIDISPDQDIFPTPVPLQYKSPDVTDVKPRYTQALVPGNQQKFIITFAESAFNKSLKILLTHAHIARPDDMQSVEITTEFESKGTILTITTQEIIKPSHTYSLIILDARNQTLVSTSYTSSQTVINRAPSNNTELQQFLPHETATYKLSYNETTNKYIFNFKINSNSSDTLQTQYEQAKLQAEEYIRSRGIDINSIVIEWRHS